MSSGNSEIMQYTWSVIIELFEGERKRLLHLRHKNSQLVIFIAFFTRHIIHYSPNFFSLHIFGYAIFIFHTPTPNHEGKVVFAFINNLFCMFWNLSTKNFIFCSTQSHTHIYCESLCTWLMRNSLSHSYWKFFPVAKL